MTPDEQKNISFPDLMTRRRRDLSTNYDDAHSNLTDDYVTLVKRNRGDYTGTMRTDRRNLWNPVLSKGFVTYPVIPRALRAKTATAMSTDIRLEMKAALRTPEKEAGAELAENVYKYCNQHHWTERVEMMIAMLGQIGRFATLMVEKDDENQLPVGEKKLREKRWIETVGATVGCMNCGAEYAPEDLGLAARDAADTDAGEEFPEFIDDEENGFAPPPPAKVSAVQPSGKTVMPGIAPDRTAPDRTAPDIAKPKPFARPASPNFDLENVRCLNPNCRSSELGMLSDAEFEEREIETGETEIIKASRLKVSTVSSLLIRFDDLHTIGFDWQKAHWFNYHPLVPRYEILATHPELENKITGSSSEWSASTRWFYELAKADGNLGSSSSAQMSALSELVEKDFWFYEPVMCHGWQQEGADYELKRNGKTVFRIKSGETIKKALERESGKAFRGLCVEMIGDEITNVSNLSFKDCAALVGWQPDAAAHVPMGEERLIPLQDAATRVLTMVYSGVQKMTNPKLIADFKFFNKKDLLDNQPGKVITSKPNAGEVIAPRPITDHIGYLTPPNPSTVVDMFINLIIQIAKEESGVYDETVGAVNSQNQTKGGRELALNQSLGLMTPTQKAKKEGKIAFMRVCLKIWQTMPDEAFTLIKGTFEEEWKPEDIKAFKSLDVDNELFITAVEGTDKPRTESDLMQNIMIAANLGLLSAENPFDPEVTNYILKRVLGITLDVGNLEADRRLAARSHEFMREIVAEFAHNNAAGFGGCIEIAPDELTGFPVRRLAESIRMTIAQDVRVKTRQEDNHAVFVGYYIDQMKGLRGQTNPSEIELLILENAIDNHNNMVNQIEATRLKAEALAKSGAEGLAAPPQTLGIEATPAAASPQAAA